MRALTQAQHKSAHQWDIIGNCAGASRIRLSVTPWTGLCQAPLSMNSLGKNTEVGCHALPPVDLPNPGIDRVSRMFPALASGFFITKATWEALLVIRDIY